MKKLSQKSEILQMLIVTETLFPGEQTAVHLSNAFEFAQSLAPASPTGAACGTFSHTLTHTGLDTALLEIDVRN